MIGSAGIMKLSEMVCGDAPFDYFPYRSSGYLTKFFVGLDLDYIHDGSTRRYWVNDVLTEINAKPSAAQGMPSREMIKVIEGLLHPEQFLFNEKLDRKKAIDAVRSCLNVYELTVSEGSNGLVRVSPLHGDFVSTDWRDVPVERLITFKPSVFQVPDKPQNSRLVAVMMPFNAAFKPTYDAIKRVADHMGL